MHLSLIDFAIVYFELSIYSDGKQHFLKKIHFPRQIIFNNAISKLCTLKIN